MYLQRLVVIISLVVSITAESHISYTLEYSANKLTWNSALATCVANGGYLIDLGDNVTGNVLKHFFELPESDALVGPIWTGLHNVATLPGSSPDFQWADCNPNGTSTNWAEDEPGSQGHCVTADQTDVLMSTATCDMMRPFVCKMEDGSCSYDKTGDRICHVSNTQREVLVGEFDDNNCKARCTQDMRDSEFCWAFERDRKTNICTLIFTTHPFLCENNTYYKESDLSLRRCFTFHDITGHNEQEVQSTIPVSDCVTTPTTTTSTSTSSTTTTTSSTTTPGATTVDTVNATTLETANATTLETVTATSLETTTATTLDTVNATSLETTTVKNLDTVNATALEIATATTLDTVNATSLEIATATTLDTVNATSLEIATATTLDTVNATTLEIATATTLETADATTLEIDNATTTDTTTATTTETTTATTTDATTATTTDTTTATTTETTTATTTDATTATTTDTTTATTTDTTTAITTESASAATTETTTATIMETTGPQRASYLDCVGVIFFTEEERRKRTEELVNKLVLNKKLLSSFRRTKTSAEDKRVTAKNVGGAGIFLLVLASAMIVVPDIITLTMEIFKYKNKNKDDESKSK